MYICTHVCMYEHVRKFLQVLVIHSELNELSNCTGINSCSVYCAGLQCVETEMLKKSWLSIIKVRMIMIYISRSCIRIPIDLLFNFLHWSYPVLGHDILYLSICHVALSYKVHIYSPEGDHHTDR